MYFHHINVLGRATGDPEVKQSKDGKSYLRVSLAVNERFGKDKKEEKASFYDLVLFGKRAENAAKIIKKADLVYMSGRPEINAYMQKKTKEAKVAASVLADTWYVVK